MKIGLSPVRSPLVASLLAGLAFLACLAFAPRARAVPRAVAVDDALADGEVDPEDLVARATVGRAVLPSPRGHVWVSLVGYSRRTLAQEREVGGFVVLGLPLDRAAQGTSRRATVAEAPLPLRAVSATSRAEPPVSPHLARSVVEAAWRSAGLAGTDDRLDSIASRARWSAILPEARVRAVRFEDERLSTDTGTESARWRDSAGANVGFEGRLTWRLDRLLYADDEPAFERMRHDRHDARARVAGRALEALFHWQRAWLELQSLAPDQRGTSDEADATLRLAEAEATLDVLTAGWFSRRRAPSGRRPPQGPSHGGDGDVLVPPPDGRDL